MKRVLLLPLFLFVLAYLLPLGQRPLASADELRYAEIPREMIASGAWVVPHLDGVRYFEKPPLGYWLNALSMELFGASPFAHRIPSVLAAGLMALIVGLLAARWTRDRRVGALSAAALLTCPFFHALGTLNILDALFSALVSASIAAFFMATEARERRRERRWLALFGVACGLSFLTKGFLAFALPVLVAVPYMLWQRRFLELFRMCWIPIGTALLVAAPWAIAIHLAEPGFWRYFLFVEHIGRFTNPSYRQHEEPWHYFLPVILLGAIPWTPLLPISWRRRTGAEGADRTARFALCWFLMPLLFFSFSGGKLFAYVLPCLPPLLLMISVGAWRALEADRRRVFNAVAYAFAGLFALGGIVGVVFFVMTRVREEPLVPLEYAPEEWWRLAWPSVAFFFGAGACLVAARRADPVAKLACFALSPVGLLMAVLLVIPAGGTHRFPMRFLDEALASLPPDTIIVAQDRYTHAVCYALERNDIVIVGETGEFKYGFSFEDSGKRNLTPDELIELVRDPARQRALVVVLHEGTYEGFWQATETDRDSFRNFDKLQVGVFEP